MLSLINKIIGDPNKKAIKRMTPLLTRINSIAQAYRTELKNEDFPKKTLEFKSRIARGELLESLLPETFALAKEACHRLVGQSWDVRGNKFTWDIKSPFDVQIFGGIVLFEGKIAEMKTGEGKTLVCTMPLYLAALEGKGAWLVTVNDYLAHRDSEWMGGLYKFLGLTVGVISHGQSLSEKQAAYNADITYGTNNEFGFDYLRDNMATHLSHRSQRSLNYAIVDEVDSILIDEARTPLIISAAAEESTNKYMRHASLVQQLEENKHYNIDEKQKTTTLTEEGIAEMEKLLGVENIYTEAGFTEVHHIEQALKARANYKRDVDYMIKDNEVVIVDEFTGRLMPGRRYSHGLHQAIEAKENVEIKRESRTLATITFQNYFRLFKKLAGMTGTAYTEQEEFFKIYGLEVIVIPPNQTVTRADKQDLIYKNTPGKFSAIVERVKELNKTGQPVLIGTISIEKSEMLSKLLTLKGVKHNVLNAKHHEREAEIIAKAGQKDAVTIATNMAGRGTDIKLGEGVRELDGLVVIGSERHESRRIDNQLRGRSGRQGDPGLSEFYVSLEDDLMRLFGSERVQKAMEALGIPDDQAIENRLISRSIESAQKKVEGHNFDIRKHLKDYDDILNKQREIIYSRRRKILESENIRNDIILLIEKEAEDIVLTHTAEREKETWDYKEIFESVKTIHKDAKEPLALETLEKIASGEELIEKIKHYLWKEYQEREKIVLETLPDELGQKALHDMERNVYLRILDTLWMEHIDSMSRLRQNVALMGYGQRDPLIEYQNEGYRMFHELLKTIQSNTVNTLFKVNISIAERQQTRSRLETPQNLKTNAADIESVISGKSHVETDHTSITKISANQEPFSAEKVGRNDACPCRSGKKYKKCHGG